MPSATLAAPPAPAILGRFIDSRELAARLGWHPGTPRVLRQRRRGPPWVHIGGSVRYEEAAVLRWIEAQNTGSSAPAAVA